MTNEPRKRKRISKQDNAQPNVMVWTIGVAALAIAAIAAIVLVLTGGSDDGDRADRLALAEADLSAVRTYTGLTNLYDPDMTYPDTGLPPVGGNHHPVWMNCGIYDEPVPSAMAVHSMEHGAVWITYQPGLAAGEVAALRDIARDGDKILLSPFPGLNDPIVVTAWGAQLELESAEDVRIEAFIQVYESAPTSPEPNVSCAGATGDPMR